MIALVKRNVRRILSSGEKQTLALRVFANHAREVAAGNADDDLLPGLAEIMCAVNVRIVVILFVPIDSCVSCAGIEVRRFKNTDVGVLGKSPRSTWRHYLVSAG
jgi:hypothetical protein